MRFFKRPIFRLSRQNAAVLLLLFITAACTRPPKQNTVFNPAAADAAYAEGIRLLESGDRQNAAAAFQRSLKANPNHAESLSGLAYLLALQGQGEKAVETVEKAAAKNSRSVDVQMTRGKIYLMTKSSRWYEKASAAFDAVLAAAPDNEEALFYKAETFFQNGEYFPAADLFRRIRGGYKEAAMERLRFISARTAANPRTRAGERILSQETLTRADLAVLLIQELRIDRLIERRNPNPMRRDGETTFLAEIVDTAGIEGEAEIRAAVELGVMSVFPDRRFRPFDIVTRMDAAMVFQQALILLTGDRDLDAAYLSRSKVFVDVKPSHYGYNAACLVTERGIMTCTAENVFAPNRPLSGIEALTAIRKLEGL